jgi:hypothetical protein
MTVRYLDFLRQHIHSRNMAVKTSELAENAYARWIGNGKPVSLWLDCDTGHDVRFEQQFPL